MKAKSLSVVIALLCLMSVTKMEAQNSFIDKTSIGFRLGWNFADMHYSDEMFEMYKHKQIWKNGYGIFLLNKISDNFAIRPELDLMERGVNLKYEDIKYQLNASYVDIRLPLIVSLAPHAFINPYLFAAPELCIVRAGEISYKSNQITTETDLALANIKPLDIAVMAGLGIEIPFQIGQFKMSVAAEAGYNFGLTNTFSEDELDGEAYVLNPSAYAQAPEGSRNNRGIEAAVMVSFPLSNLHLIPESEPEPVEEEVVEEVVERPSTETIEYEIKDCYSFDEIYSFVSLGVDVSDKRICVFDMKFEFGSAKLMRSAEQYLDNVVSMMKSFPEMEIMINGHTDNVGTESNNQKLSEERAKSVFDYLAKQGIDPKRMSCRGFGLSYPIDSNDTNAGRARNRRVEIEVLKIKD